MKNLDNVWKWMPFLSLTLFALATLLAYFYINLIEVIDSSTKSMLAQTMLILVILAGMVWFLSFIAAVYQVVTAKNNMNWKLLWCGLMIVFGVIGVALYWLTGNKELEK